jgi:threonine/homoserine/homoserine lactone efflux protein
MFLGAAVALCLSPGPDLLYVISRSVAQGTRVGLASAAGLWLGAFIHVLAVAFGLSALLLASATAFNAVKLLGAAYLAYLGVRSLISRSSSFALPEVQQARLSPAQAFRQGILIDLLNPKVAIFTMAFLPQFVRPGHGNPTLQLIMLGSIMIAIAIPIESFFVVAASRTTGFFREHPRTSLWLDRGLGTILISLGVRLALFEQRQ